jgi:GTPase SAR1 family protein
MREFPILLVGNKLDLEENREVSKERVEKVKEDNNISESMEISLETGENVELMFKKLAEMIDEFYLENINGY